MEKYRRLVCQWNELLLNVKGNKSHQFTTNTLGANIYFNSAGMPLYVADDSPFTTFESHMTEAWFHEYYYTKTETSFITAINNFRAGTGSIIIDAFTDGRKTKSHECWLWDPSRDWLSGRDRPTFSISELLSTEKFKWYTIADAVS